MNAIVGVVFWSSGTLYVAVLLCIASAVSVTCLTGVRVWTARRAWRRARNLLVGR